MSRHVLTLNAGSSSLKLALFALGDEKPLLSGLADRIDGDCVLSLFNRDGAVITMKEGPDLAQANHEQALNGLMRMVQETAIPLDMIAIGHRVVHGGVEFAEPVIVTEAIMAKLAALEPFAPLHQPHNLAGIRAAERQFPHALQIACFDTAFHRGHPFVNDTFALPRKWYEKGVHRYGFHGLSYEYITSQLAKLRPDLHQGRVIICHLGNGASACAVKQGQSIASTMGFSALDGLPMGTRCGQLDPGVILYWLEQEAMTPREMSDLLYKQSGLLGLSGLSHDMRELEASSSPHAREAIDYFVFRIRREIGGLAATLGGLDGLVFCGGIGENSAFIRRSVCNDLAWMGLMIDEARNAKHEAIISSDASRVTIMVIPTHEEFVIARACFALSAHASERL